MIECLEKRELKTSATQPYLHNLNSSRDQTQSMRSLINTSKGSTFRKNDNEIMVRFQDGRPTMLSEEISEETMFMNRADSVRVTRQFKSPREISRKKIGNYKSKSVFRGALSPRNEQQSVNMINLEPYFFKDNQRKVLSDIQTYIK